ncbi:arginase [Roseobacter litoralis]|uniref:Arginase n=1 Tax=Roseobacter litoralis (strain ATCC 49566 / DSM 6996 / JCM 21268 / NBRC 15278 / OCh 149) TaxID=391595 RepID=F7ZLA6_ROSLO|nr:arginase [Roseobacter litoralis]AEI95312.1 arginase ArcA [Roseobacter litoralis Och 149]
MTKQKCILIGVPMDCGKRRQGCLMGPDAYRTAGLASTIRDLGYAAEDRGNVDPGTFAPDTNDGKLHALNETIAWTRNLKEAAQAAMAEGLPIFMGGDHALSLGTVAGVAAHAARQDRPQFVLWLDAHPDYHTPDTTDSGNLHGTPLGYLTGRGAFDGFPEVEVKVPTGNVAMIGLRSVDAPEREAIQATDIQVADMRAIDENGIAAPLRKFLERVEAAGGMLHVSLDVDFLDPAIAPAVGTTVPGGATMREAHLAMEMLHDSGLVTSLDLVELNPFLDERGRTASLMVELTASLLGRRVFDRPTRSYS